MQDLQKQAVIQIYDAAVVSWPEGAKKPKARQLMSPTGAGALGGAFWGLLFGLIFFVPLLGMAIGAGMGALTGSLTDVGINDEFINRMRAEITPGTSALLVLSSGPVVDKVRDAFAGQPIELIQTNLSKEEADKLRSVFSDTS